MPAEFLRPDRRCNRRHSAAPRLAVRTRFGHSRGLPSGHTLHRLPDRRAGRRIPNAILLPFQNPRLGDRHVDPGLYHFVGDIPGVPGTAQDKNWLLLVQGLMVPVILVAFIWFIVSIYRQSIGISAYNNILNAAFPMGRAYASFAFSVLHFTKLGIVLYFPTLAVLQITGIHQSYVILAIRAPPPCSIPSSEAWNR